MNSSAIEVAQKNCPSPWGKVNFGRARHVYLGLAMEEPMLVKIQIDPNQVRWYCQSAMNGFDDLATDDAIENAKSDLRALLEYVDHTDKAVCVAGIKAIKAAVNGEVTIGDPKRSDVADLKETRL
jgi:hypothetical protein